MWCVCDAMPYYAMARDAMCNFWLGDNYPVLLAIMAGAVKRFNFPCTFIGCTVHGNTMCACVNCNCTQSYSAKRVWTSSRAMGMKGLSAPKTTLSPFNNKYLTARHIKIKWKSSWIHWWILLLLLPLSLCLLQFFTNRCECGRKCKHTHAAFTASKEHWHIDTTANMTNKCSLFNDCLYKIPLAATPYLHRLDVWTFRWISFAHCLWALNNQ